ncbi:MAG TPA: hypothetical protein VI548_14015 [Chitinophagaceae bacterium]|nr:hypothetical protein [Chitinophagaceae bacterium]
MEVNHHSHTARKKWTHYFWEFLMLFLAVFCGFLAEYQLEHVIENQREKKYAASMLEDLIKDTTELKEVILFWETYNNRIDTVRNEIEKKPSEKNPLLLYQCVAKLQNNNTFAYHDRTIKQLKNSGNFRLIREKVVTDSLVEYDGLIENTISNIQESYNKLSDQRRELQDQFFNSKFYRLVYNSNFDSAAKQEPNVIAIMKGKEEVIFKYYNHLENLHWLNRARIRFLKQLLRQATSLIGSIKKEYHL